MPMWWHVPPITSRFWLKVWPRGDCWEWRSQRDPKGYGQFWAGGKRPAHRFAYEMAWGFIPANIPIDHLCNHTWCVRPSHLLISTTQENVLRGNGHTANNARKTHCKHGHQLSEANTRF